MTTYSLYELNEYIRRIIALNIPRAIWLTAEIAQCNLSRGHLYLNLIQKDEETDELLAKSDAVIWSRELSRLKRKLGKDFKALMQEGVAIKVAVRVDYNERYGMKLMIEDIDPIYTIGKLETVRRETIALLEKEELLTKNGNLGLPAVLQRVALISSETAAGYQDFMSQLANNNYGYSFSVKLFSAAMQGKQSSLEIVQQLERIERFGGYDCVVITRGGGARLDLMSFDDYALNKAVANCKIPVLVGVGHETDDCIIDLVANTSVKTPTAVAAFLINHNMQFETMLLQMGQELYLQSQQQINGDLLWLEEAKQVLRWQSQSLLKNEKQQLSYRSDSVQQFTQNLLRQQAEQLNHLEELSSFLSPAATLKRGYSLTSQNGQIISDPATLKKGEQIETHLKEKTLISEIIEINPSEL
ncbi:MAG: exodeoxyribonuclease VII large subunit [Patescibacteria group bacterium]|jgi:exodeoxyribonuclease VII large subunit